MKMKNEKILVSKKKRYLDIFNSKQRQLLILIFKSHNTIIINVYFFKCQLKFIK